jgi:Reverse transcriptase (RNA-dependent DNA polymerase)
MLSARHCAHNAFIALGWLPRPFEADMLLNDQTLLRDVAMRAAEIVALGSFDAKNFSRLEMVSAPKLEHGARRIWAIMEPQDTIAYLTLALLAAPAIEAYRIPSESNIVHSHRYLPGRHRLFDERFTHASFVAAASEHAASRAFVAVCDLANCYGSISPERTAAALDRCGVPNWQVDYTARLLTYWQTPQNSGLPIGSNASRILSEAVLAQIDDRLCDAGIEYVRYVDDFRLFAADESAARQALEALRDAASSQSLTLNADKTSILQFAEATDDGSQPRVKRQFEHLASEGFNDDLRRATRSASAAEIRMLRGVRNAPDAGSFLQTEIASRATLAQAIRRAIYANDTDFLRAIPRLVERYPEIAAYVSIALCRASDVVQADVRDYLRTEFAKMLLDSATPEFVTVKLIDLMTHPDYRDRETLEQFAQARAGEPRGTAFRAVLDALRNTGGVMPSIAVRFEEMDGWGKRALLADPTLRQSIEYSPTDLDPIAAKLAI